MSLTPAEKRDWLEAAGRLRDSQFDLDRRREEHCLTLAELDRLRAEILELIGRPPDRPPFIAKKMLL